MISVRPTAGGIIRNNHPAALPQTLWDLNRKWGLIEMEMKRTVGVVGVFLDRCPCLGWKGWKVWDLHDCKDITGVTWLESICFRGSCSSSCCSFYHAEKLLICYLLMNQHWRLFMTTLLNSQTWLVKRCWLHFYYSSFDQAGVYINALVLIHYHFYDITNSCFTGLCCGTLMEPGC